MSIDPLGLDLTEADATLAGTVATLTGSVFGDCFTIGSAFVSSVPGATSGSISAGAGADVLRTNANLAGTVFSGIDETQLLETNGATIDADQIINLGVIGVVDTGAAITGANIVLSDGDGELADFSNVFLEDSKLLRVSATGLGTGQTITTDFSAATFLGDSHIRYTGGNQDDIVYGGSGGDTITGGNGSDQLYGGDGNDSIVGSANDSLFGGDGADELRLFGPADSSPVLVDGGAGEDFISISGQRVASTIVGGDGFDEMLLATATLTGSIVSGIELTRLSNFNSSTVDADQIINLGVIGVVDTGAAITGANIVLSDGDGELADFSNVFLEDSKLLRVSATGLGTGQTITTDFSAATFLGDSHIRYTGGNQDDIVYGGSGGDTITGGNGSDQLYGGDGQDSLFGGQGADHLVGGRQSDSILGATGDDTLSGGLGGDQMRGNAGNDTLEGDEGNDRLFGDEDEDMLFGGANNDRIFGGGDNDTIDGGSGNDSLFGTQGADLIYGGNGEDLIAGNTGADVLYGGNGDDTINGNEFADQLYGGAQDDTLNGGSGLDELFGGGGSDVMNGGASSDQLAGGGGADTFQFTVTGGIDRITDWQDGIDVLDFTADGLSFGDFAISTFGGGAGTKIVGGGYVVFFEGVPMVDIDATDFL